MNLTNKLQKGLSADGFVPNVRAQKAIQRQAMSDGRKGIPAGDASTAAEIEIVGFYDCRSGRALGVANALVDAELEQAVAQDPVDHIPEIVAQQAAFEATSGAHYSDASWRLADLVRDVRAAYSAFQQCRVSNDLERDARFPESRINHLATIFLIMIGDAFLNAAFYGAAATGGILHGLIIALIVSMALVGTGGVAGAFAVRNLFSANPVRRAAGLAGTALFVLAAFTLSLAAASYRDALAQDFELASIATVGSVLRSPHDLSFDALCLLVFSLVATGLSCWKGLRLDDLVPGYGDVAREYRRTKAALRSGWESMNRQITECCEASHAHMDSLIESGEADVKRCSTALLRAQRAVDFYNVEAPRIEDAANFALRLYREVNASIRQNTPDEPRAPVEYPLLARSELDELRTELQGAEQKLDQLREAVAKAKIAVSEIALTFQKKLEGRRRSLEESSPSGIPDNSPNLLIALPNEVTSDD